MPTVACSAPAEATRKTERMNTPRLAEAMAEEFAVSLPTDEAGWLEAAERIAAQVEGAGREA